jgi:hypothetical protein
MERTSTPIRKEPSRSKRAACGLPIANPSRARQRLIQALARQGLVGMRRQLAKPKTLHERLDALGSLAPGQALL